MALKEPCCIITGTQKLAQTIRHKSVAAENKLYQLICEFSENCEHGFDSCFCYLFCFVFLGKGFEFISAQFGNNADQKVKSSYEFQGVGLQ